ncbi:endonuclease MutS2 [Peptococcus simiae]|uniref:Endonuclease MutS2 n=1 Tax=Peptococcus simiae TaxID=1643805 RepID=A0ABW9GYS9_9FIRM
MNTAAGLADSKTLEKLDYFKIIDRLEKECSSQLGKQAASRLRPMIHAREVALGQAETAEALSLLEVDGDIPLGGIHDIRDLLKTVKVGGVLEGPSFLRIYTVLYATKRLKSFLLEKHSPNDIPALADWAEGLHVFDTLTKSIKRKIGDDGEVLDHASDKLANIRRNQASLRQQVRSQMEKMLHNRNYEDYFQDQILTIRNNRFVFSVKASYRSKMPGIIHDQSASGATLFIEPLALVEKNNNVAALELADREEVLRILREMADLLRPYVPNLLDNLEILAHLDLTFGKGRLALQMKAVAPDFEEGTFFELIKARHPLLDPETVVPIDIDLGDHRQALIITGPNTGGKTLSLKTAGLLILMHQSGLHIPVREDSRIGLFRRVFADIGDEQSIEQSLSTFSAHLTKICQILPELGKDTLVLYDELGAGTDPSEGAALAIAILEASLAKGSYVLATTHYSRLKRFAYHWPGVTNASVEFDVESLQPTYRLLIGVPGNSNAFAIAKRIGLEESVIDRADQLAKEAESETERLIKNLQEEQLRTAELDRQLKDLQEELDRREADLRHKASTLAKQEEAMLAHSKDKAAKILTEARAEADLIEQELKKLRKDPSQKGVSQVRQLGRRAAKGAAHLRHKNEVSTHKPLEKDSLEVGQEVYLPKFSQGATVLELPDKKGDLLVQAGPMKLNVNISDLAHGGSAGRSSTAGNPKKSAGKKVKSVSTELDIRGQYPEDGVAIMDKYLDEAALNNLNEVTIIHGKGTGILRQAVHTALKKNSHVAGYRLGDFSEGGDGATVVQIK